MPALLKSQSVLYSILSGVNGHDRDQYLNSMNLPINIR